MAAVATGLGAVTICGVTGAVTGFGGRMAGLTAAAASVAAGPALVVLAAAMGRAVPVACGTVGRDVPAGCATTGREVTPACGTVGRGAAGMGLGSAIERGLGFGELETADSVRTGCRTMTSLRAGSTRISSLVFAEAAALRRGSLATNSPLRCGVNLPVSRRAGSRSGRSMREFPSGSSLPCDPQFGCGETCRVDVVLRARGSAIVSSFSGGWGMMRVCRSHSSNISWSGATA